MKELLLSQGKVTLVDDADFEWASKFKWSFDPKGYAFRNTKRPNRRIIYLHRVILKTEKGEVSDHINGNKLDNRKVNLRKCTTAQNIRNRKVGKNNTTGYKGISWNRRDSLWYAHVTLNRVSVYAGCGKTKEIAAKAYNKKAQELHGAFALLNQL